MRFALLAALAVAICHVSATPIVSVDLLTKMKEHGSSGVMIILKEEVAPIVGAVNAAEFTNSVEKTTAMVAELRKFTQRSQEPIVAELTKLKASGVKQFWITNRVFVPEMTLAMVDQLSSTFSGQIAEFRIPVEAHIGYTVAGSVTNQEEIEWGVQNINAPDVWADGFEGQGIVVSHIDTGVRISHEAFAGAFRDTHNWLDPYTNSASPIDENGHGTHTMGTILGRGGIGVAPQSTFITCRGCDTASCTEPALLACGEWTVCPTQPDGTGEDCSKKPAISSNSWGGDQENTWYNEVLNVWRAANIVPVFAIGNGGPGCRTANSPGDARGVISVGATDAQNLVAQFSSHGPTIFTTRIKPEVSAPGNNVRSAGHNNDTEYTVLSGTSMATPHVAGAVALLLSKDGALTFDEIANLLEQNNLRPRIDNIVCTGGGVNATNPWPNNSYGWGKIDIKLASDAHVRH